MESQRAILSLLGDGGLIDRLVFASETSLDDLLEARDSEPFSSRWMTAFRVIESAKRTQKQMESDLSNQIRKAAYLQAFARWKSPDLAAYISDDFGHIADAVALAIDEPFVEDLLQRYKNGEIPCTP